MKRLFLFLFFAFVLHASGLFSQSFPDSQEDGKYYKVNGARIWTVSFGQGDPLFLISGGPGGAHPGLRSFDSLSVSNTLVYYDGYGRGKSDQAKNVKEYSLERDVEDLEGLRKAMDFKSISILGHSYGGLVAQAYALKYPDQVKHLIIVSSFHSFVMWQENDDNSNREIRTNYPEVWDSLMIIRNKGSISSDPDHRRLYGKVPYGFLYAYNPDKFRAGNGGRKPYPNSFNTDLYYQMVGKDGDFIVGSDIGNFDFRRDLRSLTMPVLILAGRFDRVAVPWMMVKYRDYCPQARFEMFEYSGHNPQVEEPGKTMRVIREFLGN